MTEQPFAYAPWPEDYQYLYVGEIDRRVAFIPEGHRCAIFFTSTMGQKVALVAPLDELKAMIAQIEEDPATKLRVVK